MKTQLLIILALALLGLAMGAFDPLSRFPPSPDWTENTQFNQPIIKWVYHHLRLLKKSSYESTPGTPANVYISLFGGSARASVVLWDCIYDTYIAGKQKDWKTISGVTYNISPKLNTAKINEAMAFAAYTASMYNFGFLGQSFKDYLNNALVAQGYDLSKVNNNNTNTASGVGVLACQNVIKNFYDKDGTNFRGDHEQSISPGTPFSDYTNFVPRNDPFPTIGHTDCDKVRAMDSWQPARVRLGTSQNSIVLLWADHTIAQMPSLVMPTNYFFRPPPPPKNITATRAVWENRNLVMTQRSSDLGDFQKAIANFWQDGEGYGGTQWVRFAATASEKKGFQLKKTIKLNHLIAHAQMEGYIVQYEGKRFYDPPRPTTPLQCQFKGQQITSWKGPYLGVGTIQGSDWRAYLPDTFVQNPTPEYPCGHCTHSGSVGAAFSAFFGDDTFVGYPRTYAPGTFPQEPKLESGDPGFVNGVTNIPNTGKNTPGYAPANPVTLNWATWTEVSTQASLSRTYLGVHFDLSHQVSYSNGRNLGTYTYNQIKQKFWNNDVSDGNDD